MQCRAFGMYISVTLNVTIINYAGKSHFCVYNTVQSKGRLGYRRFKVDNYDHNIDHNAIITKKCMDYLKGN